MRRLSLFCFPLEGGKKDNVIIVVREKGGLINKNVIYCHVVSV